MNEKMITILKEALVNPPDVKQLLVDGKVVGVCNQEDYEIALLMLMDNHPESVVMHSLQQAGYNAAIIYLILHNLKQEAIAHAENGGGPIEDIIWPEHYGWE